jgi:hypothetical protein
MATLNERPKTVRQIEIEKKDTKYINDTLSYIRDTKPNYYIFTHHTENIGFFTRVVNEIINLGYIPVGGIAIEDHGKGIYPDKHQVLIRKNFERPNTKFSNPFTTPPESPKLVIDNPNLTIFEVGGGKKKTRGKKFKTRKMKKSCRHRRH